MPRVEPGDYEALANFRYLLRKFLRFSKDFLNAKSHLSPEQYEALLAIKVFASSGGLNISQLSERLQVRAGFRAPTRDSWPKRGIDRSTGATKKIVSCRPRSNRQRLAHSSVEDNDVENKKSAAKNNQSFVVTFRTRPSANEQRCSEDQLKTRLVVLGNR